MNVSLFQAAAAMNAQSRWQEVITQNLAASSVPGYRKQDISFAQVEAGLPANQVGGIQGRFAIPTAVMSTNFQNGSLRATGNKLDFALEGPGFFEVQLPSGETGYTRDGEFHLDAQGQLVTKQGYTVLSDGGPVQFDPSNSAPLTVANDGSISQGTDVKGKLRVVEFAQPEQLTATGQGFFITGDANLTAENAVNSSVRQGFLESANTSPTAEMSQLIAAMRMFEANQKVVSMQDERLGKTISELTGN
jgi:flagellar basal-body rod protein FlgF